MLVQLQVGVKVLLQNQEGKFLVMKRATDKYKDVLHTWDIPGGRIDPGTTLTENLNRELLEETGLALASKPRLIAAQDLMPSAKTINHVVRLTYVGRTVGEPQLSDEHTEYRWVSFSELRDLPNLDQYLKKLIDEGVISGAIS